MVFFLSFRESSNGTVEAGIPTRTSAIKLPRLFSNDYLTDWDISDRSAFIRKCVCFLAFFLHIPINAATIRSYGIGFMIFLHIIWSLLNLFCVGLALWKLDIMRGERLVWYKSYNRQHFDYVLFGLFCIWATTFAVLLSAGLRVPVWLYHGWPILVVTDVLCFFAGWFATWRDASSVRLP